MSRFSLKLKIAAAGVGVALISGGCGLMEPKAERYIAPPAGSSYVYGRRDTGSYGSTNVQMEFKVGRRTWQGDQVTTFEWPGGAVLARPEGGWLGIYAGDKPVMTWDPVLSWEWPLKVGKTWTKSYRMTVHAANRTIPYEATQKVESYEEITVPAGTFKVFKISTSTTLGDENINWYSPELGIWVKTSNRRTAKHSAGPGTREDELISQNIR